MTKKGFSRTILTAAAVLAACVMALPVQARSPGNGSGEIGRYIIEFHEPPVTALARLQAEGVPTTRLDMQSLLVQQRLDELAVDHHQFLQSTATLLGRRVEAVYLLRAALNGLVLDLSGDEVRQLADSPMVKSITPDSKQRLLTDAGPEWLGAGGLWDGLEGFPATEGEGIVVGVIDSGINWEHPSFADPASDGHNHSNPKGMTFGLCDMAEVECNNKLIGVWDFVEDDPSTEDIVEENTNGRDNDGHGSHVAGIAVGNQLNVILNGTAETVISGVARHAALISYRVCYIGEPPDPAGGGCLTSAILAAIDQAIMDAVDVINYSIGSSAFSPWSGGSVSRAFLNARDAGIFVATSAGNAGPNPTTVGSPANAPWIFSVGNATHDRIFGSIVQNLSGGDTTPPGDLVGASLSAGTIGPARTIVHAKDFGYPLCGTGTPELAPTCQSNLGLTNPWEGNVFQGKIVVCDRGDYGRIEKGRNVLDAGAGGMILANTNETGESIVADDHCLPTSHIGDSAGDQLRAWLDSGSSHIGSISGFTLYNADQFGDQLNASSSRGPLDSPVQDILKPNVIAPGTSILSASDQDDFLILSGTSMSSPHMAGAAALLRAVHPGWTVSQISTALETTATASLATDIDGSAANPHERGAGRPRLGEAVNAELHLNVSTSEFLAANPSGGGDPSSLNLFSLTNSNCQGVCSFQRTVTDHAGGGSWTVSTAQFPAGVNVTVTPSQFTLGSGASRTLTIEIDIESSGIVGEWVSGDIVLSSSGAPDQKLTASVYSAGGSLPDFWNINDGRNTGSAEFMLSGLAAMPDATFTSGGPVKATRTTRNLVQDPTFADPTVESSPLNDDPFDGGAGVFTVWHNLPQGGLWLHAETLSSSSDDVDLFVGRDDNEDNDADESEVICESTTPLDLERCDLYNLPPGNYWVVVQNWEAGNEEGDDVTLISFAIDASDDSNLIASGPGVVGKGESFPLNLSWSNVNALPGEDWYAAVGVGTTRSAPNNIGVIPVNFNRDTVENSETLPLMNGKTHALALDSNHAHEGIYIDIPPDVTSLSVSASGASAAQNAALALGVFRQDFGPALNDPPFAMMPGGLDSVASAEGSNQAGPSVDINGGLTPGRYFVRLENTSGNPVAATIEATAVSGASSFAPQKGLWDFDRNIAQGAEWNSAGDFAFAVWYAFDDAGQPTWYIASGPAVEGNIWNADLIRVTNDGSEQQEKRVGDLSLTFLSEDEVVMSYTLLGASGFDPMHPNGPNTCPDIGGEKSYTGHWYRGVAGLGGSTVLVYESAQAQVHYLFDDWGVPRWAIAADGENQSATAETIPMLQFEGFCATCAPVAREFQTIGEVTRNFDSETEGEWILDVSLAAPLSGDIQRSDDPVVKLSDTLDCN